MFKKPINFALGMILVLGLAACGGSSGSVSEQATSVESAVQTTAAMVQLANETPTVEETAAEEETAEETAAVQTSGTDASAANQPPMGNKELSDQSRLVIGMLMLEGTDQTITAEQAAELEPVWESVKTLNESPEATQEQMQTCVDETDVILTTDQLTAIFSMEMTSDDIQALMDKLGIEKPEAAGTPPADMGTPPADLGTPPADLGTPSAAMGTAQPGIADDRIGYVFYDSLIALLQERAAQ